MRIASPPPTDDLDATARYCGGGGALGGASLNDPLMYIGRAADEVRDRARMDLWVHLARGSDGRERQREHLSRHRRTLLRAAALAAGERGIDAGEQHFDDRRPTRGGAPPGDHHRAAANGAARAGGGGWDRAHSQSSMSSGASALE